MLGEGVQSALINLGGNILTIGEKPNGTAFNIGIQRPFDEQNTTITSVAVRNSSVVTSGSYERYFETDDKIYHHIFVHMTRFYHYSSRNHVKHHLMRRAGLHTC